MNGEEGAGAVLAVLAVLCAYDGNCCKQATSLQGQTSVESPAETRVMGPTVVAALQVCGVQAWFSLSPSRYGHHVTCRAS